MWWDSLSLSNNSVHCLHLLTRHRHRHTSLLILHHDILLCRKPTQSKQLCRLVYISQSMVILSQTSMSFEKARQPFLSNRRKGCHDEPPAPPPLSPGTVRSRGVAQPLFRTFRLSHYRSWKGTNVTLFGLIYKGRLPILAGVSAWSRFEEIPNHRIRWYYPKAEESA